MIPPIYYYEITIALVFLALVLWKLRDLPERTPSKERIPFFDIAKGIAIILVVCLHATDLYPQYRFLHDIFWFAIPVFIVASGYLLAARYDAQIDLRRYFTNIFFRIALIYLIFTIGIRIYLAHALDPAALVLDILFGRTNGNFYFIPLLIGLYVVYPLIAKVKHTITRIPAMSLIMYLSYLFFALDYLWQKPDWNSNEWSLIFFGRYLIFFCFGIALSDIDIKKVTVRSLALPLGFYAIGAVFCCLLAQKIYLTFAWPIAAFLILLIMHNAMTMHLDLLARIGQHSLAIYLVHTRILLDLVQKTAPLFSIPVFGYAIIVIFTVALSYLASIAFMAGYARLIKRRA